MGIVLGVALDKAEAEGEKELTVQMANPSAKSGSGSKKKDGEGGGTSKAFINVSDTGGNINFIVREMQHKMSRLIYGGRVSISVGILAQVTQVLIGLPIGAIAGLMGRWVDYAFMRLIDILSSIPNMLLYLLMVLVLPRGFVSIVVALSVTGWIGIARLVRGQVLSLKATDYVRAARGMGADTKHIIKSHLIRNTLSPVVVSITLGIPGSMMAEAGLSFLGLGITPPMSSWGQMMGLYQAYIQTSWHLTVFPALVLSVTMLAWFTLGDAMRDAFDPSIQT